MNDIPFVWLEADTAKVKGYSATGRGKATVVKIEVHVEDSYELGRILQRLQECQNWKRPVPPKPERPRKPKPEPLLALPAPALRLTYQGDDDVSF